MSRSAMSRFFNFLAILIALTLISCGLSEKNSSPINNTPAQSNSYLTNKTGERGLGGTGIQLVSERGLGGTGIQTIPTFLSNERGLGGTGIIGTLTEFGSIWVNGIEIELDQNTNIQMDNSSAKEANLRIGHQVAVLTKTQDGQVYATDIKITHQMIGKLEDNDIEQGKLKVLGEWININKINSTHPTIPNIGDNIRISGYRNQQGEIQATDINITNSKQWLIQLQLDTKGIINQGTFSGINGKVFNKNIQGTEIVRLSGEWKQEKPTIKKIDVIPHLPWVNRVQQWYIEGDLIQQQLQQTKQPTATLLHHHSGETQLQKSGTTDSMKKTQRGFALLHQSTNQQLKLDNWLMDSNTSIKPHQANDGIRIIPEQQPSFQPPNQNLMMQTPSMERLPIIQRPNLPMRPAHIEIRDARPMRPMRPELPSPVNIRDLRPERPQRASPR